MPGRSKELFEAKKRATTDVITRVEWLPLAFNLGCFF
jgi:hypothetical protein